MIDPNTKDLFLAFVHLFMLSNFKVELKLVAFKFFKNTAQDGDFLGWFLFRLGKAVFCRCLARYRLGSIRS